MRGTIATILLIVLLLIGLFGAADLSAEIENGAIAGQLANASGEVVHAGGVVVFLCDAQTGRPIDRDTRQPVAFSRHDLKIDSFWYGVTDDRGAFRFAEVPPGQYRLVAQSWSGTSGMPQIPGNTSTTLVLHGVAEDVVVASGAQTAAFPRQLGSGILRIRNDPEEGNAFLLLSLHETLGDAILGPYGWGDGFTREAIGVTHMHQPFVMIAGVPEDRDVHVALLNYDNNPGVGGGSYRAGKDEARLRILASWSNGHRNPPAELEPLTRHIEDNDIELGEFVADKAADRVQVWRELRLIVQQDPGRTVAVRGLGERKLIDVLAAAAYVRLQAVGQD